MGKPGYGLPARPSKPSPRVAKEAKRAKKTKRVLPRVQRVLDNRSPKLEENPKALLALHGTTASKDVKALLAELVQLRKPLAKRLGKPNQARPFEEPTSVEFLAQKNDASLFAFGSHSKKRPHCLVLGRMYDFHILDMAELLVSRLKLMSEFKSSFRLNSAPALLFVGADFEHKPDFALLRNLLHDHFVGAEPPSAVPARLPAERVLVFTAHGDGLVSMRHYAVTVGVANADTLVMAPAAAAKLLGLGEGEGGADGGGSRHVRLTEIGPSCELKLARSRFADDELRKSALRRPKTSAKVPARVKNVSHTELLGKRGRLRIERQDLHQAALKKSKALRKASKPAAAVAKRAASESGE